MFKCKKYVFQLTLVAALVMSNVVETLAQKHMDSLKLALKNAKHDTTRCNILRGLTEIAPDGEWEKYNEQLKALAEQNIAKGGALKNIYLKNLAASLNNLGVIYNEQGDIPKALENYSKSLKTQEKIGDKQGMASSLNNIGVIYYNQGNIQKALEYYSKSLKLSEEAGDKNEVATSLSSIGRIYQVQGEIPKALEYFSKSLKLFEETRNKTGIATSLIGAGVIYYSLGNISKALEYYRKSLKIREEIGDKSGIATSLNNIGFIYKNQGDPSVTSSRENALRAGIPRALEYYEKSLKLRKEIGDKRGVANSLSNIGAIYFEQKNFAKALEYCSKSLSLSEELGYPEYIRNAAKKLSFVYKETENYKKALENFELYILMRDSIANEETKKASVKNQLKYEYEKRAAADSVKNSEEQKVKEAQIQAQNAQIKQEKFQRYALIGGLAMVMAGLVFVVNRFRLTQRQKKIIEEQKVIVDKAFEELAEKNKEVLDSIHYAKRIQRSLMSNENYIEKSLKRLMKNA